MEHPVLPLSSGLSISPAKAEQETLTCAWFGRRCEKQGEEKLHVRKQAVLDDSAIKSAS
jgi:hypothetical protein